MSMLYETDCEEFFTITFNSNQKVYANLSKCDDGSFALQVSSPIDISNEEPQMMRHLPIDDNRSDIIGALEQLNEFLQARYQLGSDKISGIISTGGGQFLNSSIVQRVYRNAAIFRYERPFELVIGQGSVPNTVQDETTYFNEICKEIRVNKNIDVQWKPNFLAHESYIIKPINHSPLLTDTLERQKKILDEFFSTKLINYRIKYSKNP